MPERIVKKAILFAPQYKKLIGKKVDQGWFDDISDIEQLFSGNKLAQSLLNEFEHADKNTFILTMLAWLYFGKSFERLVEHGEELRRNPKNSYLQKYFITSTIKLLVFRSIRLGMRTTADWEEHQKLMQLVNGDEAMDWIIENPPGEKKKAGRKKTDMSLAEMFSHRVEDKELLQNRIGEYLRTKHTNQDLARLKIALDELDYTSRLKSNRCGMLWLGNMRIKSKLWEKGVSKAHTGS
ncbi:hypothetical protein EZS27_015336 [termite gut metagenome]|uniref:Uncharacterized protein n=1 Tax=termite gut metagenome TaxID=433724 RepID=A0A5J4RTX5_9ZZZZ